MPPSTRPQTADVIVVGLGAAGAATLYQLARRGVRAIGIDRFSPPHSQGSSHGETRITRQAVGEGEVYAPLAIRSHEIWRELEAATGERLLLPCGLLTIAPGEGRGQVHGAGDFLGRASEVGRRFGVPHEILTADEIRVRYPQFQLEGPERALFEPGAGMVFPEACIRAQLAEARRLGASVIVDTPVNSITTLGGGVRIQTATGDYAAEAAVATVGAWAPGLLGGAMSRLVLQPQALHWFSCEDPAAFSPERFPAFMWMHGDGPEDGFYGFPIAPGGTRGVKLATEFHGEIASPEALDRQAPPGEAMFRRHVAGRLAGVEPRVLASVACLYATTPDSDFAIGWVGDRLLAASACSGHGFKHSAALGEMLASAVIAGSASAPPPQFDLARLSSETSTATLASAK